MENSLLLRLINTSFSTFIILYVSMMEMWKRYSTKWQYNNFVCIIIIDTCSIFIYTVFSKPTTSIILCVKIIKFGKLVSHFYIQLNWQFSVLSWVFSHLDALFQGIIICEHWLNYSIRLLTTACAQFWFILNHFFTTRIKRLPICIQYWTITFKVTL